MSSTPLLSHRPCGAVLGAFAFFAVVFTPLSSLAQAPLTISAPFTSHSPVADGFINTIEYSPGLTVDFVGDVNPGRFWIGSNKLSATPDDLSFTMYAAHTATTLFLAYHVNDQFIDNQASDADAPFLNDAVEVFLDSDRVSNDFLPGSKEGFQIISDVLGDKFTAASGFTNADWTAAARLVPGGYNIEFAIPLSLLDTVDGSGFAAAKTGDVLRFNAAVDDNDQLVRAQTAQGVLWRADSGASPFGTREPGWVVDLALTPAVPEPGSLCLLLSAGISSLGLALHRRRPRL
ncbi:MAG TPA: sugar-binding protein [Chthonomonadaceae bacterium]|nr:sugar-binding protein [Chthonomonadaceae bacterium]